MLDLFGLFFALTILTGLLMVGGVVLKAVFGLILLPVKLGLFFIKLTLAVILAVVCLTVLLPLLLTVLPVVLVFLAVPLLIAGAFSCLWFW